MERHMLYEKSATYLSKLCADISERCVGSEGNRLATQFFKLNLLSFGWDITSQEFDAMDWHDGGATLKSDSRDFKVLVSPYSRGCTETGRLAGASDISQLEKGEFKDKIVLLHGEIAKEQLMPKNFVFYNPEQHRRIIAALEKSGVKAIVCATSRNAALAGGVYPFPLIEDGDFDIPSVYMTEEEGKKLLANVGKEVTLQSSSKRVSGNGYNIIGKKGADGLERIVVTAHIDAKKGTPGAIDNGTGVVVLLILAQLLKDYRGNRQIELVALNGEDYYGVPGQMKYILENEGKWNTIMLNINIDGAGYKEGKSSFSYFDLPDTVRRKATEIIDKHAGIIEGPQWPQGDHSIFLQYGRPAIAVSSQWFIENMDSQDVTHTPKDNPEIVDHKKVIDIAVAVSELIRKL